MVSNLTVICNILQGALHLKMSLPTVQTDRKRKRDQAERFMVSNRLRREGCGGIRDTDYCEELEIGELFKRICNKALRSFKFGRQRYARGFQS